MVKYNNDEKKLSFSAINRKWLNADIYKLNKYFLIKLIRSMSYSEIVNEDLFLFSSW